MCNLVFGRDLINNVPNAHVIPHPIKFKYFF